MKKKKSLILPLLLVGACTTVTACSINKPGKPTSSASTSSQKTTTTSNTTNNATSTPTSNVTTTATSSVTSIFDTTTNSPTTTPVTSSNTTNTSSDSTSSNDSTTTSTNSESTSSASSTSSSSSIITNIPTTNLSSYYNGYYSELSSWEDGEDLKRKLKDIISQNYVVSAYSSNWDVLRVADQSATNFDKVQTVYSSQSEQLKTDTYSSSNTKGWQKEHAFCQSLMGHYVNTTSTSVTLNETYQISKINFDTSTSGFIVTYTNGMISDNVVNVVIQYKATPEDEAKNSVLTFNGTSISVYPSSNSKVADTNAAALFTLSVDNTKEIIARGGNLYYNDGTSEIEFASPSIVNYKFSGEGSKGGTSSDWHNLFASNNSGNGSRGNKNLGSVDNPSTVTSSYKADTKVFEPGEGDKGQLARGILYMDTLYDDLSIQDDYVELSQVLASDIGCHGNAQTIISWANNYPVEEHEYQHNVGVYSFQNNRNPYIDFPALVDFAYGSKKDQPGNIDYIVETSSQNILRTNEHIEKNIAVEGVKYTYTLGETFSSRDIAHYYKVFSDLTKEEIEDTSSLTFSVEEGYTFNQVGTKTITISDGKYSVSYDVSIVDLDPTQDADVNMVYSSTNKLFTGLTSTAPVDADIDGVTFNTTCESGKKGTSNSSTKGYSFGSNTAPVKTLTMTSTIDKSVSNIYINSSTTAGNSATLKVYIGGELVGTSTIGPNATLYTFDCQGKSGEVKIEWTNCVGTIYLYQLAIKY